MSYRKTAMKYGAVVSGALLSASVSAASLIPADTLTTLGTDLEDTFEEGIGWAYPIMLTFVGGMVAFMLVKRLIKTAAKG